jgi:hypothetical protein
MFVGKAGAYPIKNLSKAPFKARFLALATNNRLGWNGLPKTNTLAYYYHS